MSKRDVIGRYRGSILGLAWSFFNPILMLAVYTFVFSVVFKVRWAADGEENNIRFAIMLFLGMIVHALFAECINRAPVLIANNPNYVKKVVFPLEILPWISLGSALFHIFVSYLVLLLVILITQQSASWTALLFPIVITPLVLATMGVSWFLAAMGVYVRDISQTTGIVTMVMLFLAPIFYPISALPDEYQIFLMINPLTFIIEESRKVVIFGQFPNWNGLVLYSVVSTFIGWLGFWWFQRTRKGFADVL